VILCDLPVPLLSRIEDAGISACAPPQQRWVDGWLVRFSPGKAKRARCINAVSEGQLSLDQRLALCQALYAEARLPLLLRITPFSRPAELDTLLAEKGYALFDDTRVMLLPSLAGLGETALPERCRIEEFDIEVFTHILGEFRNFTMQIRQNHAQRLTGSPVPYRGFAIRNSDGAALDCGQMAIESELVGLYDLFTAPQARGRGLARQLCLELLKQAGARGATVAYLQVDAQNHVARSVYRRLGFSDAYSYHYRGLPTSH
jgi:ribosomal protein S18 acetylase RimI-like enzyme